jgi:predicted transcriptional regulator
MYNDAVKHYTAKDNPEEVAEYQKEKDRAESQIAELSANLWKDNTKRNSAYLGEVTDFIKLNYKCKKEESPDGTNKCPDNKVVTDQVPTDLNPNKLSIDPLDYDTFNTYKQLILKNKNEPDKVLRRLDSETLTRKFVRISKEHLFKTRQEDEAKLMDNGQQLWNKLPKDVQSALVGYTSSDYGVINSALQEDIVRDEATKIKQATSQPLGVSTILYRGISFELPKDIYKPGAKWIHKPFGSCSTGSFIAEEAASGRLTHAGPYLLAIGQS